MEKIKKRLIKTPTIYFIVLLITTNVFFVTLAGVFYGGKYMFWEYPLSFLGSNYTYVEKTINTPSTYFYSIGMFISGIIVLALILHDKLNSQNRGNLLRLSFYTLMALGFFMTCFSPDDTEHIYHVIGSIILVSALWLLITFELSRVKKQLTKQKFLFLGLLLHVPVILYASMYFLNIEPLASSVQKIAIFSLSVLLIFFH